MEEESYSVSLGDYDVILTEEKVLQLLVELAEALGYEVVPLKGSPQNKPLN